MFEIYCEITIGEGALSYNTLVSLWVVSDLLVDYFCTTILLKIRQWLLSKRISDISNGLILMMKMVPSLPWAPSIIISLVTLFVLVCYINDELNYYNQWSILTFICLGELRRLLWWPHVWWRSSSSSSNMLVYKSDMIRLTDWFLLWI